MAALLLCCNDGSYMQVSHIVKLWFADYEMGTTKHQAVVYAKMVDGTEYIIIHLEGSTWSKSKQRFERELTDDERASVRDLGQRFHDKLAEIMATQDSGIVDMTVLEKSIKEKVN